MIKTHYPSDRHLGIEILHQEAESELHGSYPVHVPHFMYQVLEGFSTSKKGKFIDHASGVSARFSLQISARWLHLLDAGQSCIKSPAAPRIGDLGHLYSSSIGSSTT